MKAQAWAQDDDALLAELGRALPGDHGIVQRVVRAAKAIYAWRTVDAELAALAYDSASHPQVAGVRSEAAPVRTMTFESGSVLVELGVAEGALVGQLVPAGSYTLALHRTSAAPVPVPVDELGCFRIAPLPRGSFSLRIRTPEGVTVATAWVSL